ncbi:MAG: glycosyltransferase family 4 protein [Prevotella sp.]|nr:glycosyltransferase family 4 protein [Prevotella sp.]
MKKLPIGMDAKRIVRNATGLGSYGRTLVNDLTRCTAETDIALRLYAPDEGRADLRGQIAGGDAMFCYPAPASWYRRVPGGRALWRSHGIVADLQRDGVQLFHGLSGELPIGLRRAGIRGVVTIHDLIFLRHPEYYHWLDAKIYAWKFRQTLCEADRIIAISECTKRDIIELGGVDASKVSVVYQSFAPRFAQQPTASELAYARKEWALPSRYILSVGTIEERKNLLLAVRALPYLPERVSLVAVGRRTDYAARIEAEAQRLGVSPRVRLLSGVDDAVLPAIYAQAEAFVYPSRYEGFGIPVIEAIAAGLPVVACTGSCLEEAGGPDSLYVDPDDAEALAAAVVQSLGDVAGREERIRRSQQYVRRFMGTDVARQVLAIYKELLP